MVELINQIRNEMENILAESTLLKIGKPVSSRLSSDNDNGGVSANLQLRPSRSKYGDEEKKAAIRISSLVKRSTSSRKKVKISKKLKERFRELFSSKGDGGAKAQVMIADHSEDVPVLIDLTNGSESSDEDNGGLTNSVDAEQHIQPSNYDRLEPVYVNNDIWVQDRFLIEAKRLRRAAYKESDHLAQAMLYLEAILYYIITGITMEKKEITKKEAHTLYHKTLSLIICKSSIFHKQQQSFTMHQGNIHSKLAILSLRCQSILYLKLYKVRKLDVKEIQKTTNEYWKIYKFPTRNTSSTISSTNSIGSQQISGYSSRRPDSNMVPLYVHCALKKQGIIFNYLNSSHDVWDEADSLVEKGSHTDFFIALDHENGPITLHSSLYNVVKYVQAGIQKLKL